MAGTRTDEELCGLVQAGNQAAANELITRYRPLAAKLANTAKAPCHIALDDVVQIGLMALFKASEKWKPGRGAKFKTVAYVYVGRAVRRYIRDEVNRPYCRAEVPRGQEYVDRATSRTDDPPPVDTYLAQLDDDQAAVISMTFGLEGPALVPRLGNGVS